MEINLFDIQRFSLFDGPGIRTTVFFKGCNLHCKWCHNPESQRRENELLFYQSKCISCGECEKICAKTHTSDCVACGACVAACPQGAREIAGKMRSTDEIYEILARDRQFYITSGGGVTLSGGEPLLQADAAAELLQKCRENGISTAIETAGNVKYEEFEKILPFTDLLIYDIKAIDEKTHIHSTGVSNGLILENAQRIKESGKNLLFRMPVVPGFNEDQVAVVAHFTGAYPLELMAYHATAKSKYLALGRPFESACAMVPDRNDMRDLAKKYQAHFNPAL